MLTKSKSYEICTNPFSINLSIFTIMINCIRLIVVSIGITFLGSCKTDSSFLKKFPTKKLPFIDSTTFENHRLVRTLDKKEIKRLQLDKILFKEDLENPASKIGISYRPLLSENYQSIVYFFYANNRELSSILANYDEKFNLIDYRIVAFDEISENILRTYSTIYRDSIVSNEYNLDISEFPTTLKYTISTTGKIERK